MRIALVVALLTASCGGIPPSVRQFATELPARADGQYALIPDDAVRKQLVMKDSALQCRIDQADGKTEVESGACKCMKSIADWKADCKDWLGAHTPQ
ncbi:MAG: hypothetical protein KF819_23880 [Labilithrix sp.]|nr:hypothetical protein [Labilithrix sp.]